jgi:mono/diheme cytochrome c family protein
VHHDLQKGALVAMLLAAMAGTGAGDEPELPAAVERVVEFRREIAPLLEARCAKCHTGAKPEGGLSLATRKALLAGGASGAAVAAGLSDRSRLVQLVAGFERDSIMPAEGDRLTREEIGVLRAWIDQGLKWDEGYEVRPPQRAAPDR